MDGLTDGQTKRLCIIDDFWVWLKESWLIKWILIGLKAILEYTIEEILYKICRVIALLKTPIYKIVFLVHC